MTSVCLHVVLVASICLHIDVIANSDSEDETHEVAT